LICTINLPPLYLPPYIWQVESRFLNGVSEYPYSNAKRYNILVVDDEYDVTQIVKKGLELRPMFSVYAFTDPKVALESIAQVSYDMMIVDIRMPEIDGFTFYEQAQKVADSKIIFITASDKYQEEYQKRFPQWNGNCFVRKPFTISTLAYLVETELGCTRAKIQPYN